MRFGAYFCNFLLKKNLKKYSFFIQYNNDNVVAIQFSLKFFHQYPLFIQEIVMYITGFVRGLTKSYKVLYLFLKNKTSYKVLYFIEGIIFFWEVLHFLTGLIFYDKSYFYVIFWLCLINLPKLYLKTRVTLDIEICLWRITFTVVTRQG